MTLGHGKSKGSGRVRLESVEVETLTSDRGLLATALPANAPSLGGFKTFTAALSFDATGYLCDEGGGTLTDIFRRAERAMRDKMKTWQPAPTQETGGTL